MIHKLATCAFLFSALASAQTTLTLVSGNDQLVPTGDGIGSQPIVFQLLSGATPVANAAITFTNAANIFNTGLSSNTIITNASGMASAVFVPETITGDYLTFTLEAASAGANTVQFYETAAAIPPTTLTLTQRPAYPAYIAAVNTPGPPIAINVFGGAGIANVSLSLVPVTTSNPPAGTVLQSIQCSVNGVDVPQVLTDSNGNATCIPVFHSANVGLNGEYNGNFSFRVVIGDGYSFGPFSYSISPLPPTISAGPERLVVNAGSAINASVTVTNGTPPFTFSLIATGGSLPNGVTLVATSGQFTGTPTTPGLYPFEVQVKDSQGNIANSSALGLSIAVSGGPLTIAPAALPVAVQGDAYSTTVSITGGVPPYKLGTSGTLPPGITGAPGDAVGDSYIFSGVPTAAGVFNFSIAGIDTLSNPVQISYSIAVEAPFAFVTPTIPTSELGIPYAFTLQATGGVPPYTFSSTALPPGLTLSTSGVLSGTPTGAPGTFPIAVTVTDAANERATASISIGLAGIGAVVNAASSAVGGLAPGELVSIYGVGLGPATGVNFTLDASGGVATSLAGVSVSFGQTPAVVLYASSDQVNVVVPFEVIPGDTSLVTLTYNGVTTAPFTATGQVAAPGVFLNVANGATQGAILNSNYSVNGPNNPAAQGDYVQIYATGSGPFTPPLTDGQIVTAASTANVANVSVTIGGLPATVLYAGAGPGLVAGVLEINVVIPTGITPGPTVPLVVTIGGFDNSAEGVTLSVGP